MILKLLRVSQWYKNLMVFLPLVFVQELFNKELFLFTFLGLISLCLISSSGYIINDVFDIKKDRLHAEKRLRPIASGRISVELALVISFVLIVAGSVIAVVLSRMFLVIGVILFLLTLIYSLLLKKEPFLDILIIAINFVIRALAGAIIIDVVISPWLVLCPFFLALFLATGKRESDLQLLGKQELKKIRFYTPRVTNMLMIITTTLLIMCYAFFSILSSHRNLVFTLPIALFLILRYLYLVEARPAIARTPHKMIKDLRMIVGVIAWLLATIFIIYVF